jgi:hypothetical protein
MRRICFVPIAVGMELLRDTFLGGNTLASSYLKVWIWIIAMDVSVSSGYAEVRLLQRSRHWAEFWVRLLMLLCLSSHFLLFKPSLILLGKLPIVIDATLKAPIRSRPSDRLVGIPQALGRQIRIKARSRYHIESGPTPKGTLTSCVYHRTRKLRPKSQLVGPVGIEPTTEGL